MNRIILIGNGFDLAHGLKTSYRDFMNSCRHAIEEQNEFWSNIIFNASFVSLENWVDIENEYYKLLKDFLKENRLHTSFRWPTVKKLNTEFCEVKNMLEKYLADICNEDIEIKDCIVKYMVAGVKYKDIALSKRKLFFDAIPTEKGKLSRMVANAPSQYNNLKRMTDQQLNGEIEQSIKRQGISVLHTLVLNFNYTKTAEKYSPLNREYDHEDYGYNERPEYDTVNIHGELNNPANPIIFGYGDELDEDYKAIEKTNDNDFLDNIKSIQYHNTGNYRKLLSFLEDEPYQVFIMGHSCGNSDRTLLNTIFEHENCVSVKPFFYQWRDEKTGELKDNYTELAKNISRNFNDKQKMRDVVVNREYCLPLVPCAEDVKTPADV